MNNRYINQNSNTDRNATWRVGVYCRLSKDDELTGDRNKSRYLLYQLKLSMARAKQIDIIVLFLMESGVRMLLSDLQAVLHRGVRIRIFQEKK